MAKAECTKARQRRSGVILALVDFIKPNQSTVVANPEVAMSMWYLFIYPWHHSSWEDSFLEMVALHSHPQSTQGSG